MPFRINTTSPVDVAIQIPPCGSGARWCDPGGTCEAGNTSRTWKSRIRTSFLGLPHAAQMFPSTSSVSPTTIPSGWRSGSGRRRNRPSLKRYSPSSTPTHRLPARSSSMAATWFPGRPWLLPMDVTVPFLMRSSDPLLATQIVPSRLARMPAARSLPNPCTAEKVTTRGSRKLSMPLVVPAQTMPSRSSNRAHTESPERPSV